MNDDFGVLELDLEEVNHFMSSEFVGGSGGAGGCGGSGGCGGGGGCSGGSGGSGGNALTDELND